jgi:NAD(P)-dependent dehydrogenase (short-subunit alcohol dehydrogenase family)
LIVYFISKFRLWRDDSRKAGREGLAIGAGRAHDRLFRKETHVSQRVSSTFGYRSTAREVAAGHDLRGKSMIVTGGASGIGVETVRALAHAGAGVTIAARNRDAGLALAHAINAETGAARVDAAHLDLADLGSVGAFASSWLARKTPLHVLIDNAGVMACPHSYTAAGFETQVGVNHLGHFALTDALRPALAAAQGARVVSLSSIGHRRSAFRFDDPHFRDGLYDKGESYGQSKTANSLFAVGITRRWASEGVSANAVMPGGIMTALQRHLPKEEQVGYGWIDEHGTPNPRMKTPEQGAATSVWAAIAPELEGVGGRYLENCAEAGLWSAEDPWSGVMPDALDADSAERLWE